MGHTAHRVVDALRVGDVGDGHIDMRAQRVTKNGGIVRVRQDRDLLAGLHQGRDEGGTQVPGSPGDQRPAAHHRAFW